MPFAQQWAICGPFRSNTELQLQRAYLKLSEGIDRIPILTTRRLVVSHHVPGDVSTKSDGETSPRVGRKSIGEREDSSLMRRFVFSGRGVLCRALLSRDQGDLTQIEIKRIQYDLGGFPLYV